MLTIDSYHCEYVHKLKWIAYASEKNSNNTSTHRMTRCGILFAYECLHMRLRLHSSMYMVTFSFICDFFRHDSCPFFNFIIFELKLFWFAYFIDLCCNLRFFDYPLFGAFHFFFFFPVVRFIVLATAIVRYCLFSLLSCVIFAATAADTCVFFVFFYISFH